MGRFRQGQERRIASHLLLGLWRSDSDALCLSQKRKRKSYRRAEKVNEGKANEEGEGEEAENEEVEEDENQNEQQFEENMDN